MLSKRRNEILTQVGPGTPMGELLRRYWTPIAGASELDANPIKPMRLFGEDLVLYRDLGGQCGLVERHCAHRRADLAYGFVEPCGIRCNYHGWLYDQGGQCIDQPYEDTTNAAARLKDEVRLKAYPVREAGGLLFAYLGPDPAPELPVWQALTLPNGFREVVVSEVPCNWLQCQENSIDPVHFEWMHDNWNIRQKGKTGPYSAKHLKIDFEEFEYGFTYKRVREGGDEKSRLWTVGRVCLWPIGFFLGDHFEWRVPIDDANTLSIAWFFTRVPKGHEPYVQKKVPTWYGPVKDEKGDWIASHTMNQDFIAWVGQGTVADRSKETLGTSDRGIALLRRRFFQDLDALADGRDPSGLVRDPKIAQCIPLPMVDDVVNLEGLTLKQWHEHPLVRRRLTFFPWQAGQPPEVWADYVAAMGFADKAAE